VNKLLLVVVVGCGSAQTSPVAPPPGADSATRIASIERHVPPNVRFAGDHRTFELATLMRNHKVPAVSVAVFDHYQLQWAHAWGYANVDKRVPATDATLFRAGSLSETPHVLAVLETVADGKLALDRPINDQLVSWKLSDNELTQQAPVTLRELLGHVAGMGQGNFSGYAADATLPTAQQILAGAPPANSQPVRVELPPGTTYRYSEAGIVITQLALVDQWHQPYPEILAQHVFAPLGMTHSTYEQPLSPARKADTAMGYRADETEEARTDRVYPEMAAAGLWTTPSDLARLFAELALARTGGSKLISKEIAMEMTTKSGNVPNATPLGTWLFEVGGVPLFGRRSADNGFRARVYASLGGGYGAVIMTNSDNGAELCDRLFAGIADEYHWPAVDRPLVRVKLDIAQRAAFTGWYFQPNKTLLAAQISETAGALEFRTPFNSPRRLVAIAMDTLVDPDSGSRVRLAENHALAFAQKDEFRSAFLPAGSDPPILFMLEAGHFDEAVKALRDRQPGKTELDELNDLAYGLMADQPTNAVKVCLFAVTVFPASSNARDSLGEAYVAAHEPTRALAAYRQALALVDADPFLPADLKTSHRKNAEDAIARLQAH